MEGAHNSFISSTYWTEGTGHAAALAVLKKMQRIDVPSILEQVGNTVALQWQHYGEMHGLPVHVESVDQAFAEIAESLNAGNVMERLKGPPAKLGFFRLVT